MIRFAVVLLIAMFGVAAYPALSAIAASRADISRGQNVYEQVGCYECHGHVGQGGLGPKLAPTPLPLKAFALYVRSPAREMPPYSPEVLSAQDIVDIHAYLSSIPPLKDDDRPALLRQPIK